MIKLIRLLIASSIGKKSIMAVTGLGAIVFLITHLGGNLLVYAGRDASNAYAHHLHSIPGLAVIELGLFTLFAIHIVFGIILTIENYRARPIGYSFRKSAVPTSVFSSTMIYSGALVLIFMSFHVWTIKYGLTLHGEAYDKTIQALSNPHGTIAYMLGICALGFHLFHGAESTFQSLGLKHPKYESFLVGICRIGAVALTLGFLSIPVYVWSVLHGGGVR